MTSVFSTSVESFEALRLWAACALILLPVFLFLFPLTVLRVPEEKLFQIANGWKRMLLAGPDEGELCKADHAVCAFAVAHRPEFSWSQWGLQDVLAARISFPPDQIALLSYENQWTGSTILLGSDFGLAPGVDDKPKDVHDDNPELPLANIPTGTGNQQSGAGIYRDVHLIRPGRRVTLVFGEDQNIRSSDNIRLSCHLSLHLHLAVETAPRPGLARIARSLEFLPCRLQECQAKALDILRTELASRTYQDCMGQLPEIVRRLNELPAQNPNTTSNHNPLWRKSWSGNRTRPCDDGDPIQVEFTALTIAPRINGEYPAVDEGLVDADHHIRQIEIANYVLEVERRSWEQRRNHALAEVEGIHGHFVDLWKTAKCHAESLTQVLLNLQDSQALDFIAFEGNFHIFPEQSELEGITQVAKEACDTLRKIRTLSSALPSSSPN